MSQDIIRSTKEHEVVIPEGSINAKSKTSTVASGTIEPEHVERVTTSNTVVDRRVSVDEAQHLDSDNVKLGPDDGAGENRVRLPESQQEENRVRLPETHQEENRALLPEESLQDNTVLLPSDEGLQDHRVKVPSDAVELSDPDLAVTEENHAHGTAAAADTAAGQATESFVSAQVETSVADKRREEFVGRVVKLREEVDQLNQRLDRLEK
jgi:hypothetical protein